jgi:hypothetical protein
MSEQAIAKNHAITPSSAPSLQEIAERLRHNAPLDTADVAVFTRQHPESVRRCCRRGRIKATRPVGARDWMITRQALADWLRVPVASLIGEGAFQ